MLLALRAGWTHEGGTWGLPGGARDSHEDDAAAALREAEEEVGVPAHAVRVLGCRTGADHGSWRYTYVIAVEVAPFDAAPRTQESDETRWQPLGAVSDLTLHHGLALAWPVLLPEVGRMVARHG